MMRNAAHFEAEHVFSHLGLSEELSATAIYGTQLVGQVPKPASFRCCGARRGVQDENLAGRQAGGMRGALTDFPHGCGKKTQFVGRLSLGIVH